MKNKLFFATITNAGSRDVNEDSIGVFSKNENSGFVLCDGLGGHGLGDVASKLVVDVFQREFDCQQRGKDVIADVFELAQEQLLSEQRKRNVPNKMKTTAVLAVADKRYFRIGHIGDSRAYVFRKNKVMTRTIDHSIPQMLALSKQITDSEIRNHPDRNMLLRVMGIQWQEKQYELMKPIPLRKVQAILLCSDGFWELIDEDCMCQCLEDANTVEEWLATMTQIVQINGKGQNMDNYSAIAVWNHEM